jgi:hypothetical protein
MKITKLLVLAVSVFTIQSAFAIRIEVKNLGNDIVEVDPVWTGTARGWKRLDSDWSCRYDSGVYQLKGLLVRYADGQCRYYFFGQKGFRGTGKLIIGVNAWMVDSKINASDRQIVVEGHTDVVFQKQTQVSQVVKGNTILCDRVNNFR